MKNPQVTDIAGPGLIVRETMRARRTSTTG